MRLIAGIAVLGLLAGLVSAAQPEKLDELDTVLVTGEHPGPGLWKVSKGDHVMWVLAAHAPLPKDMVWRSRNVEARIAESQEVLYQGRISVSPNIGLFKGITLIPAAIKAAKLPDDKTLKDVLAPDTYAKWLSLRKKYIGKDDDIEKVRPALALQTLRNEAFKKSKLGGATVYDVIGKARKKHKVRSHELPKIERKVKVEDPRGILKSAQKLDLPDIDCFTKGINELESDLERARRLANAWSRGDITTLRSMHRNMKLRDAVEEVCIYTLMSSLNKGDSKGAANAKKMTDDILWHAEQAMYQAQQDWVAAARVALDKNRSTFAVLSLAEIFSPDGHLEKLKELGYTVEEPAQVSAD